MSQPVGAMAEQPLRQPLSFQEIAANRFRNALVASYNASTPPKQAALAEPFTRLPASIVNRYLQAQQFFGPVFERALRALPTHGPNAMLPILNAFPASPAYVPFYLRSLRETFPHATLAETPGIVYWSPRGGSVHPTYTAGGIEVTHARLNDLMVTVPGYFRFQSTDVNEPGFIKLPDYQPPPGRSRSLDVYAKLPSEMQQTIAERLRAGAIAVAGRQPGAQPFPLAPDVVRAPLEHERWP